MDLSGVWRGARSQGRFRPLPISGTASMEAAAHTMAPTPRSPTSWVCNAAACWRARRAVGPRAEIWVGPARQGRRLDANGWPATQERQIQQMQQAMMELEERERAWRAAEKVACWAAFLARASTTTARGRSPSVHHGLVMGGRVSAGRRRCATTSAEWNETSAGPATI